MFCLAERFFVLPSVFFVFQVLFCRCELIMAGAGDRYFVIPSVVEESEKKRRCFGYAQHDRRELRST